MAEIWYLDPNTVTLEGIKPKYILSFKECIELLELEEHCWKSRSRQLPKLKSGDPLIDESGYIYVLVKVMSKELKSAGISGWKAGWYISPITLIAVEKKMASRKGKSLEGE